VNFRDPQIYLFIYLCFGVSVSTVERVLNSTWVDL
jgi:hypothetical protein